MDLFVFNFNGNVTRLLDLFWCHYFVGKNIRFWMIMHTIWHLPLHFLFQKIAFFIFIFLKGKNCILKLQLMGFFFKNAVLKSKTPLSYCSFLLHQNFLQTLQMLNWILKITFSKLMFSNNWPKRTLSFQDLFTFNYYYLLKFPILKGLYYFWLLNSI